jgi:TPR repeat protein
MNAPHRVGLALLALILGASCEAPEPEPEIMPVITHPPPEIRQQAETGDAAAQWAMAAFHQGDKDPVVMLHWLRSSACQGHPLAQVSLGVLYEAGDGVPDDPFVAYAWFTWAAEQGDPEAAQFAAGLYAAMEADERAFAETLLRDGWMAMLDCRVQ